MAAKAPRDGPANEISDESQIDSSIDRQALLGLIETSRRAAHACIDRLSEEVARQKDKIDTNFKLLEEQVRTRVFHGMHPSRLAGPEDSVEMRGINARLASPKLRSRSIAFPDSLLQSLEKIAKENGWFKRTHPNRIHIVALALLLSARDQGRSVPMDELLAAGYTRATMGRALNDLKKYHLASSNLIITGNNKEGFRLTLEAKKKEKRT